MRSVVRDFVKSLFFRDGASRRCFVGPYAGLTFEVGPPLHDRMSVFYSAYEPTVTRLLDQILELGMTFCNVGAHVGIHSLYAAKQIGRNGKVYAFEAWPKNIRFLQRNVALNEAVGAKVQVVDKAVVHSTEESVRMSQGHSDGTHHVEKVERSSSVKVDSTTLDHFFSGKSTGPDVVLVDVEGKELEVLRGAANLVDDCRPSFVLEHHGAASQLAGWLTKKGYRTRAAGQRHLYAWCS